MVNMVLDEKNIDLFGNYARGMTNEESDLELKMMSLLKLSKILKMFQKALDFIVGLFTVLGIHENSRKGISRTKVLLREE